MARLNTPKQIGCAWAKDDYERNLGSSGGVFGQIAKNFVSQGGAVIGARFDDEFNVIHSIAFDEKEVEAFCKSKYVMSNIKDVFNQAEAVLESGKRILFSGTPCQVCAFLTRYKKYLDQIYTIDIVCHGTPKSDIWKKYIKYLEEKYGSKIVKVDHRKKDDYEWGEKKIEIKFANGKVYLSDKKSDPFLQLFLNDIILRDNCYRCNYARIDRPGDVTLGDNWQLIDDVSIIGREKGLSLFTINTEKGKLLLDDSRDRLNIIDKVIDMTRIRQFNAAPSKNILTEDFLFCLGKWGMGNALAFYTYMREHYSFYENRRYDLIMELIREIENRGVSLLDILQDLRIDKPYIYGGGCLGQDIIKRLGDGKYSGLIDKRDELVGGVTAISPSHIPDDGRMIVLSPSKGYKIIVNELVDLGIDRNRLVSIYLLAVLGLLKCMDNSVPMDCLRYVLVLPDANIDNINRFEKIRGMFPQCAILVVSDERKTYEEMIKERAVYIDRSELYYLLDEIKLRIECLVDLRKPPVDRNDSLENTFAVLLSKLSGFRKKTFAFNDQKELVNISEYEYEHMISGYD